MKLYLFIFSLFFCAYTQAQTSIKGKVVDESNQPIPGANIKIVGESIGTATDFDGNFALNTSTNPPFEIEISSIGFQTKKYSVIQKNQQINAVLQEEQTMLNEIVISASRTPERILESPVTVERMGIKEIQNTTAPTFYEGLENLKEVHFNTSSLNFKSINTRGFATVANTRFMQLVDGMDNSSPALNFVLGNLIGLSELDVQSVELLPGASSALYGANAFNGILFMNSKSPFEHEGISAYTRNGITTHEVAGQNDYWDVGFRAAKAFSKKIALKANFTYLRATEWIPADNRNVVNANVLTNPNANSHAINTNYDGLNTYGDEVSTFLTDIGQVSRTGYREQDLNDNSVENTKFDFSTHYRPFVNNETEFWNTFEIIGQYKIGLGNTTYQGANRYRLENFLMQQAKLEFKNDRFFARFYLTSEDAGDSYDMRFTAWNINRQAKTDQGWFTDYGTAFLQSQIGLGLNAEQAAAFARNFADNNVTSVPGIPLENPLNLTPNGSAQFQPGSPEFINALQTVIANPDLTQGSKFIDQSRIYHSDLNYNLKDLTDVAEIQVGGSLRQYELNSQGTIFTDFDGPIRYNEFGAYTQVQKKFLDDKLKFTGSMRYDKSQNFEGQVSPRVSLVYSAGEKKNHNFRASFQTGFRNPTTQDQYIGLDLGPFALIGSAPDNLDRYVETLNISAQGQSIPGVPATVTLTGRDAYQAPVYSVPSVTRFSQTRNPADLEVVEVALVKPERVNAFEVGYKSVLDNGLSVDINAYYNIYNDFMSTSRVIKPYYGEVGSDFTDPQVQLGLQAIANGDRRVYQVYTNTTETVTSLGFGVGLTKKVFGNYELGANYNFAEFEFDQAKDPAFIAGFNTPKHRVKATIGNSELFKNFGFNFNARWSSEYLWQSSFADGMIPEVTVFDAQVNYSIPKLKSVFKLSAANLFGEDYLQVIGAGRIGQQFLVSWTVNP